MSTADGKPETINSVSVETAQSYKAFNLIHGDITRISTDLIVLSAYGSANSAPEGQVVQALLRQGVVVATEPRWLNFSERCWTCFQERGADAGASALLTVFIPHLAFYEDPLPIFEQAVRGVFASLAALEYTGLSFRRVSLPVLYGQRILREHSRGDELYPRLTDILIQESVRWLRKSDQTHTVQFVVFEEAQVSEWDVAINRTLGRSLISAGSDAVLKSLCQEIVDAIRSQPDRRLAGATAPLAAALSGKDPLVVESVCVWARKLVEAMLMVLLPNQKIMPGPDLASNIDHLGTSKAVAPWIVSYMHSLRIFGNESVHVRGEAPGYHPARLDKSDLVSALSAVRSLLAFWPGMDTTPGHAPQSLEMPEEGFQRFSSK